MPFMNENDYNAMKTTMQSLAAKGDLPQCIALQNASLAKIGDIAEMMHRFQNETGLDMSLSVQVQDDKMICLALVNFFEPEGDQMQ